MVRERKGSEICVSPFFFSELRPGGAKYIRHVEGTVRTGVLAPYGQERALLENLWRQTQGSRDQTPVSITRR